MPALLSFVPGTLGYRFRQARNRLYEVIDRAIQRRRQKGFGADLLSCLLLARDETTGVSMSDECVRDEAITILLAGYETIASYMLAQTVGPPRARLRACLEVHWFAPEGAEKP